MEPGAVLRAAREAVGISLRGMAERTYYGKTYLSLIETGQRPVPAGVVAAYERVLGADLGRLTAVARTPASVDTAALSDVAVMLAATRRIEDVAGAVTVLPAVRGISAMTEAFAREARTARNEAAALASEVTQYRGWLEHAIGADGTARRSLGAAVSLAEESRDPDRLAHSLGFLGYVTMSAGNHGEVVALSDAALAVRDAHPTVKAYGRMRRAELLAAHGEAREAQRALAMADAAAEAADGIEPPASMYWWSSGFGAVQRGGVLSLLGRTAEAVEEATHGLSAMPAEHRRSEWLASALRRVDPDMSADA
ncbi:helix-turn-helix domain-containing protein [Nocardia barduliensis]|uniref:helix-turn-helix domain-containing protein n=1 Tax=Nocardia barduliensis TaxID=2736643 RepID=UPI0015721D25|nr:helix-turn-helix transcriptional regulator [Nocardia barduliensis]